MTELLCALTILLPSIVSFYFIVYYNIFINSVYDYCTITCCFLHCPFSFLFHIKKYYNDPCYNGLGLVLRRLDYTFIHISSILLSYGLSHSFIYGTGGLCLNSICIYKIWTFSTKNNNKSNKKNKNINYNKHLIIQKPPVYSIGICILYYLYGLIQYCRYYSFFKSIICVLCMFLCTFYDVTGYAFLHILCGFLQYFFIEYLIVK